MSIARVAPHGGRVSRLHVVNGGVNQCDRHNLASADLLILHDDVADVAPVVCIDDAPSARRRRELLRAEDPAMHRRPQLCAFTMSHSRHRVGSVMIGRGEWGRAAQEASEYLVAFSARMIQVVRRQADVFSVRKVAGVGIFALSVVVAGQLGLALQPGDYTGPTVVHSVRSGESLWSLAASVDSDRPLEQVVADIEELNNLSGGVDIGQHLVLPTR